MSRREQVGGLKYLVLRVMLWPGVVMLMMAEDSVVGALIMTEMFLLLCVLALTLWQIVLNVVYWDCFVYQVKLVWRDVIRRPSAEYLTEHPELRN